MNETILQTNRILLKSVTPDMIRRLFENSDKTQIQQMLGADEKEYERYKRMYESGMETFSSSLLYFLLVKKENNQFIGECGFHTWNKRHNRAEVFYLIKNEADKRQGYMSEVLPLVLDFGFKELKLHRIEAYVAASNLPSVKVLAKNCFVKEGTAKEHYLADGHYEDSDCYALLNA
jgi:ribosomal-protein-alanine N-acetyltransferase